MLAQPPLLVVLDRAIAAAHTALHVAGRTLYLFFRRPSFLERKGGGVLSDMTEIVVAEAIVWHVALPFSHAVGS